MPYRFPLLLTALVAAGAVASPAAAAVGLNGSLFQQASSQVGRNTPVVGRAMNSWDTAAEDLAANATATARGGADRVFTRGKMAAHWDSADAGSVTVLDHGWDIAAADPAIIFISPLLDSRPDGDPDWSYTFTATERGAFSLDFDLFGVGDIRDLGKWRFGFADLGGGAEATDIAGGFSDGSELSGALTRRLASGHTYTVSLRNLEGFSASGPVSSFAESSGHEHGAFNWAITGGAAVPEPAAWAMMIAGFGLAGATLRRRNATAVA
jgi:hypothetical protein